jgi:hypothetical protein
MSKTVKIHESVEVTYHDDHRIYLIVAYDPVSEMDIYMLNINNNKDLARAEVAFDGYEQIKITSLEEHFGRLADGEHDLSGMVQ